MRGILYNLTYNKLDDTKDITINLNMKNLTDTINKIFLEDFKIEFNCNRNHIYNLMKREHTCNKFI